MVQEALTNAQKHGGARGATIQVQEDQASVHVTVQDDGRGFDTTAQTRRFGLIGMHERADLLGGTLNIQSNPGHGTTVTAAFPARRRSREQAA
ncbi:MAG: ATP-binding protein [Solirubrobacteraceae bacterium]